MESPEKQEQDTGAASEVINKTQPVSISLQKKIIFSAFILFIFLIFIEIAARFAGCSPFPNIPYADSDYEVEWELTKNFDDNTWLTRNNPDNTKTKIRITTNSTGLRNEEFPLEKQINEKRILFLGDSVTFGFMLNAEETLPYQTEQILRKNYPDKTIRVINAGVDGYSTFQEYHYLKKHGLKLKPDIVLIGFVLNDVFEPHLTSKARGGSGNYAGLAGKKTFTRTISRYACKSAFFTKIFFSYLNYKNKKIKEKHTEKGIHYRSAEEIYDTSKLFEDPLSPEIQKAWEEIKNDFVQFKKLAELNKLKISAVIFPYAVQVSEERMTLSPQKKLISYLDELGIEYLDLAQHFINHKHTKELFLVNDGNHLSPAGSAFTAEIIAEYIKEKLPLPDSK